MMDRHELKTESASTSAYVFKLDSMGRTSRSLSKKDAWSKSIPLGNFFCLADRFDSF